MADHSCGTCRFAHAEVGVDDQPRLDCRRFPPVVAGIDLVVVFPQVNADDWCGEHRPDAEGGAGR